jgi:hypothetical protein
MGQLSISNIINISVSTANLGLNNYNTSNLGLFTNETPGLSFGTDGFKAYVEPTDVAADFGSSSQTYKMALAVFSQQPNILAGDGQLIVILLEISEDLDAAITRTASLVQYFGVMTNQTVTDMGESQVLAAAAVIQALNKIAFFVSYDEADLVAAYGILYLLMEGGFTQSRGLYYGDDSDSGINALLMMSAYAGRGLSVNFTGSNTTITMNLKTLNTIQPDPSMTQTIYNEAVIAGADIYPSIQGNPAVISNGANKYFDQVYNLLAFVGGLQIAGYNYLAQTGTKVPQTENGMDGLKGAYRGICQQYVINQYLAPGTWTSPTTFGNQVDLYANIQQQGYYIFSQPIGQQAQVDRAARKAPLVQIAVKEAGAIQESDVIIFVNA